MNKKSTIFRKKQMYSIIMDPNCHNNESPQLHPDVLLSVTEKLLFSPDNDFRMDLRNPNCDIIKFMFAGPACRWAFFTQFRRLTKLNINGSEVQLSCQVPIQGIHGSIANKIEFFQGPFIVSDMFFYALLCQGVLQPKNVESFFKFGLKASRSGSNTSATSSGIADVSKEGIADESPVESLVRLFLFKDSPEILSTITKYDFINCNLELDILKIQDDTAIFKHIGRILNLNAKCLHIHIEMSSEIRKCVPNFQWTRVNPKRTKSVIISYTFDIVESKEVNADAFPYGKFLSLLRYITECCQNLDSLVVHFLLSGEFTDEDFQALAPWLQRTVQELTSADRLTAFIVNDFPPELTISFRAFFPQTSLQQAIKIDHELATMGEQQSPLYKLDNIDVELSDTCTIARRIQLHDQPLVQVVYSLIGIDDENDDNNIL